MQTRKNTHPLPQPNPYKADPGHWNHVTRKNVSFPFPPGIRVIEICVNLIAQLRITMCILVYCLIALTDNFVLPKILLTIT